jgi:hypothetical protein
MEHEKKGRESVSWRKKENGNTEGWVGSVPPTQHQGAPDVPCVNLHFMPTMSLTRGSIHLWTPQPMSECERGASASLFLVQALQRLLKPGVT